VLQQLNHHFVINEPTNVDAKFWMHYIEWLLTHIPQLDSIPPHCLGHSLTYDLTSEIITTAIRDIVSAPEGTEPMSAKSFQDAGQPTKGWFECVIKELQPAAAASTASDLQMGSSYMIGH
jgi:hypothetical protein